jgi:hypothetical protein
VVQSSRHSALVFADFVLMMVDSKPFAHVFAFFVLHSADFIHLAHVFADFVRQNAYIRQNEPYQPHV